MNDNYNNNNNILHEHQFLDIYSTPLQSSNGMYMAYMTANCEFIICQRDETAYNSWFMIWTTTTDFYYTTTTTQCRVSLVGPQLMVLFYQHPRSPPQIVWKSSNKDDEDDEYEDYIRRRKRKQHLHYYLKLQDAGVLVLYKRTKRGSETKNKINLVRGVQSILKRAASNLFSKRNQYKKQKNEHENDNDIEIECIWSSSGIRGRAGCAIYGVQVLFQTKVATAWNHLWENWSYESLMQKTAELVYWGRDLLSKSYIRIQQIVEQAQYRAKERVDF